MTPPMQLPQKFACWTVALSVVDDPPVAQALLAGYVHQAASRGELDLPEQWHFEGLSAEIRTELFGVNGEPPQSIAWLSGTVVAGAGAPS
jgi:hypothetical protein